MVFLFLIPLLALGVGMGVNNAKAVLEGMFSRTAVFERTPKFGESGETKLEVEQRAPGYRALKSGLVPFFEVLFGTFFLLVECGALYYGVTQNPIVPCWDSFTRAPARSGALSMACCAAAAPLSLYHE